MDERIRHASHGTTAVAVLVTCLATMRVAAAIGPTQVVVADLGPLRTIFVLDVDSGAIVGQTLPCIGFVRDLAVSPDGEWILAAQDGGYEVLDASDPARLRSAACLSRPGLSPTSIRWAPDGRAAISLATFADTREWLAWDGVTLASLGVALGLGDSIPGVLPDGRGVLVGRGWEIGLEDAAPVPSAAGREALRRSLPFGADPFSSIASTRDARQVVALWGDYVTGDGIVAVVDAETLDVVAPLGFGLGTWINATCALEQSEAFLLDAGDVGTGRVGRILRLAPIGIGMAVQEVLDLPGPLAGDRGERLTMLPDGRIVLASTGTGVIVVQQRPALAVQHIWPCGVYPRAAAAVPARRRWSVLRGMPSDVTQARSVDARSPFDDDAGPDPARLGDGTFLAWSVVEEHGPEVLLRVDKAKAPNSVRLSWRDFDRATRRDIDPAQSRLRNDRACHGLAPAVARVSADLRDDQGDPLGIVEGLLAEYASVAPAQLVAGPTSDARGTAFALTSDAAARGPVALLVSGARLQPTEDTWFNANAPSVAIDAPLVWFVGEEIGFTAVVTGGMAPFSYEWDLDADGTIDSTEAEPITTYSMPGDVELFVRVSSADGCSGEARRVMPVE